MALFCLAGLIFSLAFIVYILFLYPLLLGVVAGRKRRPVRTAFCQPSVSIILAVHNGESFVEDKLCSILGQDYPRDRMEVLVVSDGSTDHTDDRVRAFGADGVRLIQIQRAGKPAALNAGVAAASGDILVFTDVRQKLEQGSLSKLMENFADPEVGAASAELVILGPHSLEEARVGLYWRYEAWIRLRLSAIDSIFGATGAYYALRRELAVEIPQDALLDDMHLPLAGFFRGFRLIVDPRARMYDYPTGLKTEFRRKVRTLAGNYQILRAYPRLLTPANRMLLHFCSYKLGRLLLPFALIAALVCSFGLPHPYAAFAVGAQGAFYLLAIADRWVPEGSLKRITSTLRTFVTMMVAALFAVSILFLPSSRFWRPTQIPKTSK